MGESVTKPVVMIITSGDGHFIFGNDSFVDSVLLLTHKYLFRFLIWNEGQDIPTVKKAGEVEICELVFPKLLKWIYEVTPSSLLFLRLIFNRIGYSLSVLRYLVANRSDVLYFMTPTTIFLLTPYILLHRKKTVLHSMNMHHSSRFSMKRMLGSQIGLIGATLDRIEDLAGVIVSRIVVECQAQLLGFHMHTGIRKSKFHVIETSISPFWFEQQNHFALNPPFHIKKGDNKIVVLFWARLYENKGAHILLNAANVLVNKRGYNNLLFIIVGPSNVSIGNPSEETAYTCYLRKLIKEYRLDSFIFFSNNFYPTEVVKYVYSLADVYVLPTYLDLTPHTIKQAMAMGKPVIASAVGGVPELVSNGETGFLFEVGSVDGLCDRLERLINSAELREKMGRAGRQKASAYTNEARAYKLLELFEEITDKVR